MGGELAPTFFSTHGSDALATAATTPRPEHEATGAESACIGGRGIYERRLWQQTRRVPQSLGGGDGARSLLDLQKEQRFVLFFFLFQRSDMFRLCICRSEGKKKRKPA